MDAGSMSDFDAFIATLRQRTPTQEPTGMHAASGAEIHTGDIVEFWFDEARGYSATAVTWGTRMVDVVERINGAFYTVQFDVVGGSHLWRVDDSCTIVGSVHGHTEPLRSGLLRFSDPDLFAWIQHSRGATL